MPWGEWRPALCHLQPGSLLSLMTVYRAWEDRIPSEKAWQPSPEGLPSAAATASRLPDTAFKRKLSPGLGFTWCFWGKIVTQTELSV